MVFSFHRIVISLECVYTTQLLHLMYIFVQPEEGDDVIISTPFLLDESPPDLSRIVITNTGRLVWSPDTEINVRVNYILVGGRLDIGSEDCPYEAETTITLTGILIKPKISLVNNYYLIF